MNLSKMLYTCVRVGLARRGTKKHAGRAGAHLGHAHRSRPCQRTAEPHLGSRDGRVGPKYQCLSDLPNSAPRLLRTGLAVYGCAGMRGCYMSATELRHLTCIDRPKTWQGDTPSSLSASFGSSLSTVCFKPPTTILSVRCFTRASRASSMAAGYNLGAGRGELRAGSGVGRGGVAGCEQDGMKMPRRSQKSVFFLLEET